MFNTYIIKLLGGETRRFVYGDRQVRIAAEEGRLNARIYFQELTEGNHWDDDYEELQKVKNYGQIKTHLISVTEDEYARIYDFLQGTSIASNDCVEPPPQN